MIAAIVVVIVFIGIHKADQYERNHARRQHRLKLREHAHEEMKRINFLWPR